MYQKAFNIKRKQVFEAVFMDKGAASEKLDNITRLLHKDHVFITSKGGKC